jgi:hypothetical protein
LWLLNAEVAYLISKHNFDQRRRSQNVKEGYVKEEVEDKGENLQDVSG